ncbi:NAD(P)/FAD-dependent oxidoreductase [Virgibacillus siamensis]|uniref:NAD(P)/FAD-dependent oxidoreductase n=1 Tax=Virgibacillus siamensis TaxID=480071 RepID=UPI00098608A8|nr:NAD(P)/FAD-dependent oxidoreductase [Virgibacillus siamensis]
MNGEHELFDVTIIGGGSAGLFAAYYTGMRDMKTKIIENQSELGGTVSVFYPEKYIYDVGGISKISGEELVSQLKEQALMFDPTIIYNQKIEQLNQQDDGTYILTTHSGEVHYTKTVIIAVGPGAFSVNRLKLNHGYIDAGDHIHYETVDPEKFAGKDVLLYGGINSAVTLANSLSGIAKKVYLMHKHNKFKSLESELDQLHKSNVEILTPYTMTGLDGDALSAVHARHIKTKEDQIIPVDDLIICQGYSFDLSPVSDWGFTLESRRIPVNENMETHMKGVFVAGDIAGYPQKWRLLASAFNEAITAANHAKYHVDPSAVKQVYSSIVLDE